MCFKTCTESWNIWLLWILLTSSFSIFDIKLKGSTHFSLQWTINSCMGFPRGSVVKNTIANAVEAGSIPGSGRSPGEGNGNPLQYSCLENAMDRGAWQVTVHGVEKSQTWLSDYTTTRILCIRSGNQAELRWVILLLSVALAEVAQDLCLVDGLNGGSNVSSCTCLAPRQGWPGGLGSAGATGQSTSAGLCSTVVSSSWTYMA